MPKISQERQIIEYLLAGNTLSPMDALRLFNCWALSSRTSDINHNFGKYGVIIKSKMEQGENGKHYARYYIEPKNEPADTEHEATIRNANLAEETRLNLAAV